MTENSEKEAPQAPAPKSPSEEQGGVSILSVMGSVFRAWFGVQSEKNRQRDFASKDPTPFIVAAVIFVALIIGGVIITVNVVLSAAGK